MATNWNGRTPVQTIDYITWNESTDTWNGVTATWDDYYSGIIEGTPWSGRTPI